MSESRRSSCTARFQSTRFDPIRSSGRTGRLSGRASARLNARHAKTGERGSLRGRPSNETQRLTPLQADLLGEVREVRGESTYLGGRLPLQLRNGQASSAAKHSGPISVRLVRAVSGRIAEPLAKFTSEERFLARWTLLFTAVSAPLAMLCFTLVIGLDLTGVRTPPSGATQVATSAPQRVTPLPAATESELKQASEAAPEPVARTVEAKLERTSPLPAPGVLAAAATADRWVEQHEPSWGTVAAGVRAADVGSIPELSEEAQVRAGGFLAQVGTPGGTRDGSRRLPLRLAAFDRSWTTLTLEAEFPVAWQLLHVEAGPALREAGALLRVTPRAGGATLELTRPPTAERVGDGEVAVLILDTASAEGDVSLRVVVDPARENANRLAAFTSERRLVLD